MAWSEFDGLTNEQLLSEIGQLRDSLQDVQQNVDDRGYRTAADDYMGSDMNERLDLLIAEAVRRGLVVPEDEPDEIDEGGPYPPEMV